MALVPKDTVSAQLIQRLQKSGTLDRHGNRKPAAGRRPVTTELTPTVLTCPNHRQGRPARWKMDRPGRSPDTTITLSFLDDGKFSWKVAHKGQDRLIQGKLTAGNGLLTLAQDPGAPMVGNLTWS